MWETEQSDFYNQQGNIQVIQVQPNPPDVYRRTIAKDVVHRTLNDLQWDDDCIKNLHLNKIKKHTMEIEQRLHQAISNFATTEQTVGKLTTDIEDIVREELFSTVEGRATFMAIKGNRLDSPRTLETILERVKRNLHLGAESESARNNSYAMGAQQKHPNLAASFLDQLLLVSVLVKKFMKTIGKKPVASTILFICLVILFFHSQQLPFWFGSVAISGISHSRQQLSTTLMVLWLLYQTGLFFPSVLLMNTAQQLGTLRALTISLTLSYITLSNVLYPIRTMLYSTPIVTMLFCHVPIPDMWPLLVALPSAECMSSLAMISILPLAQYLITKYQERREWKPARRNDRLVEALLGSIVLIIGVSLMNIHNMGPLMEVTGLFLALGAVWLATANRGHQLELRYYGPLKHVDLDPAEQSCDLPHLKATFGPNGIEVTGTDQSQKPSKLIPSILILLGGYSLLKQPMIGACLLVVGAWLSVGKRDLQKSGGQVPMGLMEHFEARPTFTGTLREGMYLIARNNFLWKSQVGVGVVVDGVLHTLFHVTKGSVLEYNGELLKPYSFHVNTDTISYGGPWNLKQTTECAVQLLAKPPGGIVERRLLTTGRIEIDGEDYQYIICDFPPGTSGSPITNLSGEVVGLYGNGFIYEGEYCSVVTSADNSLPEIHETTIEGVNRREFVNMRPGAGKTRRVIVERAKAAIANNKKLWILAPTRVVKKEIQTALEAANISHGTKTKHLTLQYVTVLCHSTFTKAIIMKKHLTKRKTTILMDEAHFKDPASIAARGIMEHMYENGSDVVYMTATMPGFQGTCDSNFPIEDIPISTKNVEKTIKQHLKDGKKVVHFVPTIAKTQANAAKYQGIAVNRRNFEKNYQPSTDDTCRYVATTDISEMGANFNADVVVDERLTNTPVVINQGLEQEQVILSMQETNNASRNQRRGRVGRRKPGVYHALSDTRGTEHEEVCWMEAQMILDNLEMTPMPEEMENFKPPMTYAIYGGSQRQKFFEDIFDHMEDSPPIWLAWKLRNANIDPWRPSWLYTGESEMSFEDEMLRPRFFDARLPFCNEFLRKVKGMTTPRSQPSQRSAFSNHIVTTILSTTFWNRIVQFLQNHVDRASLLMSDEADSLQAAEALDSAVLLGAVSVAFLFFVVPTLIKILQAPFRLFSQPQNSRSQIATFQFKGVLTTLGFVFLAYRGIPEVVLIVLFYLYITVVPLLEDKGHTRSSLDIQLITTLIAFFSIIGVLVCWELNLMPNIKNDILSVFKGSQQEAPKRPTWSRLFMDEQAQFLAEFINISSIVSTFLFAASIIEVLRHKNVQQQSAKVMAERNAASNPRLASIMSTGLSFAWVNPAITLPVALLSVLQFGASTIIGALLFYVPYYVVYNNDLSNINCTLINILCQSEVKGGEVGDIPQPNRELLTNFAFYATLACFLMICCLRSPTDLVFCSVGILICLVTIINQKPPQVFNITLWTILLTIIRQNWIIGTAALAVHYGFTKSSNNQLSILTDVFSEGYQWKSTLNSLTLQQFDKYRLSHVQQRDKGDYVSKGGNKIEDLSRQSGFQAFGNVVDLGCGRGGFSQWAAQQENVTKVNAYTIGGEKHEMPQPMNTYGHNIIVFKDKINVYEMPVQNADTIMCDIGESNPNPHVEEARTMRNIQLMKKWKEENPQARVLFKVLCPYAPEVIRQLEKFQNKWGGGLYRCVFSRNSTMEMYFITGKRNSISVAILQTVRWLMKMFTEKAVVKMVQEGPKLPKGTRAVENLAAKVEPKLYETRLQTLKKENSNTWFFDPNNPYKTFKYLGSFATEKRNPGGQATNKIVQRIMWPWEKRMRVTKFMMTDISARAQQQVLREKVDTQVREPPPEFRTLNRHIQKWIYNMLTKKLKPRILTPTDFMETVKNQASVGGWSRDIPWESVQEAMQDPEFWEMVDEERERHLRGDCKYCVYNTMGKKEKKPSQFGRSKGSRTIWYLWLGGRFLEFEALGFLNVDHWVARENLPCGVGGTGVNYLGYVLRDIGQRNKWMFADDVAGWDTRVSQHDLDDEETIANYADPYHAALIRAAYKMTYKTIVAMFPREHESFKSQTIIDVCVRKDQRGSGQVVTYALNTITNAKVQLGRLMECHGYLTKELSEREVFEILDTHGLDWMQSMAVAGDDVVVGTNEKRFATSINYINQTGKIRKDIELEQASPAYASWEDVSFCSHHFHELVMKDGRELIVPCRDQDEIIGRARSQKGGLPSITESCGLAKAYAQMWSCYFFHRRDLRIGSMAICSAVPDNWVPTGRTSWSIHQKHEWMTQEDMLRVWNRVWILDNPWMDRKDEIGNWSDIPYLHKGQDIACGSLIGSEDRKNWAKELPSWINKIRQLIGNEKYTNYLTALNRYKPKQQFTII